MRRSGQKSLLVADTLWTALPPLILLLAWEIWPRLGGSVTRYVVPPSHVAVVLWSMLKSGELLHHGWISLWRALSGALLACAIAVPLGFLIGGWVRSFERAVGPILNFLSKLNPFSLFPLFVMLLGIGEVSKTAIVFWVSLWPVLFNTVMGIKGVDPLLVRAARTMGCGPIRLFLKVMIPAASPAVFLGVQMACGTSFFILIAAEMIGASRGLGWLVWNAQVNFVVPQLFAATVAISALGLSLNALLRALERRWLRWHGM